MNDMNNEQDFDDFEKELSKFDDDYNDAPEKGNYDDVPDGKYTAYIERAEMTKAQTSGNPMLKLQFRIIESSSQNNRVLFRNSVLRTAENVGYLKQDLVRLGIILEKFSDLPKRVSELLDLKVEIMKKTKDEYENVYIQKCLGKVDTDGLSGDGLPDDDDDIHF
jgi:hypothetical protein